ncbi:MAG: Rap1a/Tai family immunity protein [Alphaproteobacteria bacterium]
MPLRKISFLVFLVVLAFFVPAHAARFSGEYLLNVCSSDQNGRELVPGGHIACQSYISGVMDYHNLIRSLGTAPSVDFCVPENESLNVIQSKVAMYLFQNKKIHGAFIASPAVTLALYNYYPCGKKKN